MAAGAPHLGFGEACAALAPAHPPRQTDSPFGVCEASCLVLFSFPHYGVRLCSTPVVHIFCIPHSGVR